MDATFSFWDYYVRLGSTLKLLAFKDNGNQSNVVLNMTLFKATLSLNGRECLVVVFHTSMWF